MKISCQACGTKYTIADDKVRGRKVRVRCKSCSTPIVVDTSQPQPDEPAAEAAAPGDAAPADGDAWTVNLSDTEQRPMTTEEIVSGYHAGTVTADAFVWKEGMEDWVSIFDQPELRARIEAYGADAAPAPAAPAAPAAFEAPPPEPAPSPFAADPPWAAPAAAAPVAAAPPAAAAAPAARRAGGRAQGAADLFGSVASAGSEEESAAAAAALPGSTAYDAKVTGARNENSVLFSLDSLKAGFTAPKPAPSGKPGAPPPKRPSPGRPGLQSAPDDPFGMSSGNSGVARLGGGGNALFSLGDNQLLMAAPPPPPEPPPPPVVTDPVSVEYAAPLPAKKGSDKRIFILGGAAAAVLIIGVVLAVALSGGKKEEPVAQNDTSGEKADKEPGKETKPDEGKSDKPSETKPEEEKKAEAEPAATAPSASAGEDKKPPTEEEKKRFAEAQKKEQEKKEADKAGEKKPELPTPTDGPPFNKGAAIAALSSAASASSGCKRPGGPTGSGKALVTFAPSGRVTSANVTGGSFGGTSVGGCVASVFRRAKVPAFGGGPVTVSKSFTIAP